MLGWITKLDAYRAPEKPGAGTDRLCGGAADTLCGRTANVKDNFRVRMFKFGASVS